MGGPAKTHNPRVGHSGVMHDGADMLSKKKIFIDFFHVATGKCISFKGMINSFDDNFSSEWNDESVYGRMDDISTFVGTKRVISMSWKTAAYSIDEARENLHRVEHLVSMLYPVYDKASDLYNANTIMAAPLLKIKFGNLIRQGGPIGAGARAGEAGLVGKVEGFTNSIDDEVGYFDYVDPKRGLLILPKIINLAFVFHVKHTEDLGWDATSRWLTHRAKGVRDDAWPYGLNKLTGPYSHCSKTPPESATNVKDSRTADAIKKRTNNNILNGGW